MTLYRIRDWDTTYETAETRKLEALRWVPVPNKHDGLGFRRVAAHRNRAELLAAWVLLAQVASKGRRGQRGSLSRDGKALNAEDLSLMTGFPAPLFEQAFTFFSDPRQGWLVAETPVGTPAPEATASEQLDGNPSWPAQSPGAPATPPARPADSPAEGKEGKEEKGMEGMEVGAESATPPAPAAKRKNIPDAEWLAAVKADPAYAGIDVDREFAKAARWCETNRKILSRARLVNWLNRCERPMQGVRAQSEFKGAF